MHKFFLKKYCFIDSFQPNLIKCQHKSTTFIYRNYKHKFNIKEIIRIRNFIKFHGYKFILSNNVKLALKLDLDGAYLPSFNNNFHHLSYSYKNKFELIGSAHNLREINIKKKQKINDFFLSSIFKNNKNYLGINRFKLLIKNKDLNFIALGGIEEKNIKKLKLLNIKGFAGISYFKKKAPQKRGLNN